ncbi:DNA replication complex GINS protein SLD5-like [Mizuhopecten yessoensis]|uniref:DNA replication complex GINS protein SLD5-like n=1 Tax=Mizuhopecten yessoensis TaxID=6573 RepID=UPI000B457384|nr:DNA replication complex GINS protein SLD5-like [Mizuhopecten yessoensis]
MSELDEFGDGSDEEGEAMTAAEVLQKLEEAWRNEKFSPDLLDAKMDLVECMLEQLVEMEENIRRAKRTDMRVSIHRMEIDRIRYIISSYLRCRLQKVERYTVHILDQERQRREEDACRMSPEEFTFAKDYAETLDSHFRSLALRHMPPNLQTLDTKLTATRPNMDKYVFLQVNDDTEGVLVEEETLETGEEIVDLQKGDQHIMRYKPMAPLVSSGAVTLI